MSLKSTEDLRAVTGRVDRVLVATKYRFIGDTLLAVPLLRSLSQHWPDARVSLLTGGNAHELLLNCPFVHDFIEFDPYRQSDQGLANYIRLVARLRKRNFDLAFVCNRSFHSALTATLGGASKRVGWSGFEGRDFLLTSSLPYDPNAPEIEAYGDLLRCVAPGAYVGSNLELWVSPGERRAVPDSLQLSRRLLVGIQPGATHDEKRWPAAHYAHLAERILTARQDVEFVLVGGPDEGPAAQAVLDAGSRAFRDRTISLVGQMKLRETLAALTYLDLFIAGDTAIRHAAMALDIPSIALFGPTSMQKWGNALPPRHQVLCAPSRVVADISVDEVVNSSLQTLEVAEPPASKTGIAGLALETKV